MEPLSIYEMSAGYVLVLGMSTIRLTIAFLVTPLFTDELVPPLIKNSIFISLAIIVTFVHPPIQVESFSGFDWIALFAKEAFIGLAIGFFFGLFLWAFEAAGIIIDTQIGASMAMVYDPISGHEVTLYGEVIGRWVHYLFIASGGLLLLTVAILDSYLIWPIDEMLPDLRQSSVTLFEQEFGRFASLVFMIASPVVVVVLMVDLSMGLINRFAKRLDIVFISLALKNLIALIMVVIMIPVMAEILFLQLDEHSNNLEIHLDQILAK